MATRLVRLRRVGDGVVLVGRLARVRPTFTAEVNGLVSSEEALSFSTRGSAQVGDRFELLTEAAGYRVGVVLRVRRVDFMGNRTLLRMEQI